MVEHLNRNLHMHITGGNCAIVAVSLFHRKIINNLLVHNPYFLPLNSLPRKLRERYGHVLILHLVQLIFYKKKIYKFTFENNLI